MTEKTDRLISAVDVAYRAGLRRAYRKALRHEIPGPVKLGRTVRFNESKATGGGLALRSKHLGNCPIGNEGRKR